MRNIIEKLKVRLNISFAEVNNNDVANCTFSNMSTMSNRMKYINSVFGNIRDFIENNFNVYIVEFERNLI